MNAQQYIEWLNNPYQLTAENTVALKNTISEYPYLQSARALYLKALNQQRSFLYNSELKKTAAYTTDRDVLFDYIVSEDFITYKPLHIEEVDVVDENYIEFKKPEPTLDETIEKRVLDTLVYIENQDKETELIQKIDQISKSKIEANKLEKESALIEKEQVSIEEIPSEEIHQLEENLEVGKPLDFSENDKFSFTEWLKLTSAQPIQRETEEVSSENIDPEIKIIIEETIPVKQKQMDLIDRFIETNPKITPSKSAVVPSINLDRHEEEEPFYMTETLARIYLEQKKYQKAIQAYEILILKYPEKSSLFANRISDIKKLQEFNNI